MSETFKLTIEEPTKKIDIDGQFLVAAIEKRARQNKKRLATWTGKR